jgi:ribosome-interacting GTPase 1
LCSIYIPAIYVLNKIDQISIEELDIITKIPHCVPISAHHRWNYDGLLEKAWDYLDLNRMYVWFSSAITLVNSHSHSLLAFATLHFSVLTWYIYIIC